MIKILVLDDETGTCEQLRDFFSYRGYKVFGATEGEEAVSIIKKEKPQILLLDIRMPGINGLEVLKQAKEINDKAKVVIITALAEEDKKSEALKLGADEYIAKPFSYEKIEGLIIKMVNEVIKAEGETK